MILPSLKQLEALKLLGDTVTNFIGYGGAAFGGKSLLGCQWLVTSCIAYAGTRWGLCRKELVTLKKTTLNTLFKVLDDNNLKLGIHYRINWQTHVITFNNRSEIYMIDMAYHPSDPLYTRFGGYELTGAFVDESNECPLDSINILFTRLGRCLNSFFSLVPKLLETFNPSKNHVYTRYFKPWRDGMLKKTMAFIRSLPTDNPSPEAEAYVANILANSDRQTIERLIFGNFEYDDDPNQLIDYEAMLNAFTNRHLYYNIDGTIKQGKKYITGDIAFLGSDIFVVWVWNDWTIIDCVVMDKSNPVEVEQTFKRLGLKHGIPQSQMTYDADGLGSFLKGYLSNARSFHNGSKAIQEQGQDVEYENLKAQCFFKMATKINNNEVFIHEDVANLKIKDKFVREHITDEIPAIKRDNSSVNKQKLISKKLMKELIGHSPDYLDAMMQRVLFDLKPSSYRAPKVHNLNR